MLWPIYYQVSQPCNSFAAALRCLPITCAVARKFVFKVRASLTVKILQNFQSNPFYLPCPWGYHQPHLPLPVLQGSPKPAHSRGPHVSPCPSDTAAGPGSRSQQLCPAQSCTTPSHVDPQAHVPTWPWPVPSAGRCLISRAGAAVVSLRLPCFLPASPGMSCSSWHHWSWGAAGPHVAMALSILALIAKLLTCSHGPHSHPTRVQF